MANQKVDIQAKYKAFRDYVVARNLSAFIVVFHGTGWLARTIQFFCGSYFNHVGIGYVEYHNGHPRIYIIDSNENGLKPDFMSARISKYADFALIEQLVSVEVQSAALEVMFDRGEKGTKYDFLLLGKIAIEKARDKFRKWFGMEPRDRVIDNNPERDICSEAAKFYRSACGLDCSKILTPHDFIRFYDKDREVISFNSSPIK